jgi:hypothetical protein
MEPVTIPPVPRKAVNLRAEELLTAVRIFLGQQGLVVSSSELFPEQGSTGIQFNGVTASNRPWPDKTYIFFTIGRKFSGLTSRLGNGPFHLEIRRSRSSDESKSDAPTELLFDIVACANPDRSITFKPVKRRDGTNVYF